MRTHALSEYCTCSNTTAVAGILQCMCCLAWNDSWRLSTCCCIHVKTRTETLTEAHNQYHCAASSSYSSLKSVVCHESSEENNSGLGAFIFFGKAWIVLSLQVAGCSKPHWRYLNAKRKAADFTLSRISASSKAPNSLFIYTNWRNRILNPVAHSAQGN